MQVANALNNQIRILFNPLVENFKLFDFLMVKSNEDKYLAQIIEIYDDKFDASQNVAKLKLFYKISQNNEVLPYDNFTPNKECEIIKIKQEEVETFINNQKETFVFGKNAKSSTPLALQYDFFNNNAIILADKLDDANIIFATLAKKLSSKKHSVILDSTGSIEFEGARKIKAPHDFKIPLNYETIDYVFDKLLEDASLEFQSIVGEIINEIKKFAKEQDGEFIPFSLFLNVIQAQYKATPYTELKLLIVKLKKYQMDSIFAATKKDKNNLTEEIKKNDITIIDLSNIPVMWQKPFFEYIASAIEDEIYLFSRINEENSDVDSINKIYCHKKNISFVPSASYNFKKLPSVSQFCKNYMLLSSLYQRNDFLNANFALNCLIAQNCLIFGENTDEFIYLAKDFGIVNQEQKKIYRKIALSLLDNEEEKPQPTDSEKLLKELSKIEAKEEPKAQETKEELEENTQDEFQNLADYKDQKTKVQEDIEKIHQEEVDKEAQFSFVEEAKIETKEAELEAKEELVESLAKEQEQQEEASLEETNKEAEEEAIETLEAPKEDAFEEILEEEKEEAPTEAPQITLEKEAQEPARVQVVEEENEEKEEPKEEEKENFNLTDDELDFFQIAKESSKEYENTLDNKVLVDNVEYKKENLETDNIKKNELQKDDTLILDDLEDEDIDLGNVAQTSLDDSFSEIINSDNKQNSSKIEGTELKTEILEKTTTPKKENLPIFKEENKDDTPNITYQTGQYVLHGKYGRGQIVKIVKYEQRQLLQIDFPESGKKLLDPKIANIKLEQ